MRTAAIDENPMEKLSRERVGEELPKRNEAQKIGTLVAKTQVSLVGGLLLFQRAIARVRDRQGAGDHQHLGEATGVLRRKDHPADSWIDRKPRELTAKCRQTALRIDRAEF